VLCCAVLCCAVLCCAVPCCAVLRRCAVYAQWLSARLCPILPTETHLSPPLSRGCSSAHVGVLVFNTDLLDAHIFSLSPGCSSTRWSAAPRSPWSPCPRRRLTGAAARLEPWCTAPSGALEGAEACTWPRRGGLPVQSSCAIYLCGLAVQYSWATAGPGALRARATLSGKEG
jgi:hypothetical protein